MHEQILSCNYNPRPVYNNWSFSYIANNISENNSEIKNLHAAEQDYNWEISHYLVLKESMSHHEQGIPYRDIGTTARDISSQKCT